MIVDERPPRPPEVRSTNTPPSEDTESRLEEIAQALFRIASLDFDHSLPCRGDGTVLDAVVGCINMLAEELRANLDERARVSQELEDRVRARTAELEASKERYRMLVETTHVVPWELDPELRVSYVAPQVAELFGEPPTSFVGNASIWGRTHPDDRERLRRELFALTTTPGGHANLDYRITHSDGRTLDVRSIVSAKGGAQCGPTTLRGVTLDITPQRKLESELRQAQKLEAVGRLAAGVAHEINTPIQFIGDNLRFLKESLGSLLVLYGQTRGLLTIVQQHQSQGFEDGADFAYLAEEVPKAIAQSVDGISQVGEIVRAIKTISHQDRSHEQVPVDLRATLQAVVAVARSETKEVADVVLELAAVPPVVAFGSQLGQVFLNLVVNAAHSVADVVANTGKRGTIRVKMWREEDFVVVAVEDTGAGVPEGVRERIFDLFFTTKGVGRGSGQGLTLARTVVVDGHGGTLTFETEVGRGTTFFVRLPIAGIAPPSCPEPFSAQAERGPDRRPGCTRPGRTA